MVELMMTEFDKNWSWKSDVHKGEDLLMNKYAYDAYF